MSRAFKQHELSITHEKDSMASGLPYSEGYTAYYLKNLHMRPFVLVPPTLCHSIP